MAESNQTDVESFERRAAALEELLTQKGAVSPEEMQRARKGMDAESHVLGVQAVVKAWTDPAFKERLLEDATAALEELGVHQDFVRFVALENTGDVHNMVVCTLCSCYPRWVLGRPPRWYKSFAYRSRAVRDPRGVLEEFGVTLPPETEVRVHDSTADLRYLVIPRRPPGTEGWSEERLAALVSRDSMVGVALAREP